MLVYVDISYVHENRYQLALTVNGLSGSTVIIAVFIKIARLLQNDSVIYQASIFLDFQISNCMLCDLITKSEFIIETQALLRLKQTLVILFNLSSDFQKKKKSAMQNPQVQGSFISYIFSYNVSIQLNVSSAYLLEFKHARSIAMSFIPHCITTFNYQKLLEARILYLFCIVVISF